MRKHILIILILVNLSFCLKKDWSSTPIEKFINNNFRQMIFREPLYLIPYDLKVGIFSYGGPGYFENAIKGDFSLSSNPILLDNQDINNDFISSSSLRNGFFMELDIMKYNLLDRFYNQNLIDFHIGTGLRYSSVLSNPEAPIYIENSNESYRFRPSIFDGFFNISSTIQYSPRFYLYSYYSFGLSYASIYESLSQKQYINGSGFNENLSFGYKYVISRESLPYNYTIGLEFRIGRTYLNKIYDPKNETPIIALDMNMYGLFFSFGTLFGGDKTRGDEAYKMMLKNDYIRAADKFKQFLNVYTDEFRYDDAKEMLNFCYTQIPYQYFDIAVSLFDKKEYDLSLINFNKAEQIADPDLILEIESYKRDIAQFIIDDTDKNLDKNSFSKSIKNLNRARQISPYLWPKTDRVEAKILIRKGDILRNLDNYSYAIDYYQEALELDPSLFIDINDKYTELVIQILNDVNDTNHASELILIREYLYSIIDLKPRYADKLNDFIVQIDNQLSNYNHALIKSELKSYIAEKKTNKIKKVNLAINLGISPYELETILGEPDSIVIENEYELWIYNQSNKKFKTYFFKDYLLVKIN